MARLVPMVTGVFGTLMRNGGKLLGYGATAGAVGATAYVMEDDDPNTPDMIDGIGDAGQRLANYRARTDAYDDAEKDLTEKWYDRFRKEASFHQLVVAIAGILDYIPGLKAALEPYAMKYMGGSIDDIKERSENKLREIRDVAKTDRELYEAENKKTSQAMSAIDYVTENPLTTAAMAGAGIGGVMLTNKLTKGASTAATSTPSTPFPTLNSGTTAGSGGLLSKIKGALSRIPKVGKLFGAVAAVGTAVVVGETLAPNEAQAAQNGVPAEPTGYAPQQGAVAEVVAAGADLTGVTAASAVAKTGMEGLGGLAAKFGLKAIPGVGAIIVGGENLYDVAKYTLKGEFEKAGTQLVAGVAETVAYIPGAIVGATVGTALKEGIRAGAVEAFGESAKIDHSMPVEIIQAGIEIAGEVNKPAANNPQFKAVVGM